MFNSSTLLVVSLITAGLGMVLAAYDWRSRSTRPLAIFLVLLGLCMSLSTEGSVAVRCLAVTIYALTFIAGIETAHRIGRTVKGRRKFVATVFIRIAQLVILAYWLLALIYALSLYEPGLDSDGLITATGLQFALFAPLIGSAIALSVAAGFIVSGGLTDRADLLRLRVIGVASPFLISGLVLNEQVVPFVMAIGIVVLIAGVIRYQMVQGRRGAFMRQFMAPEVAELVRDKGMEHVMRRERRVLTVVMCDLRGFTAYARANDSDQVVELLEAFYKAVGHAANAHGGTIKDHAGDGVMLLVGAPVHRDDHAAAAMNLALDIKHRVLGMLAEVGLAGELGVGVGIATGQITVGAIRGAGQLEYVAVGNAVNLAARLCDRAVNGQLLSDVRTVEEAGESALAVATVEPQEPEPLKGFAEPVSVCSIR